MLASPSPHDAATLDPGTLNGAAPSTLIASVADRSANGRALRVAAMLFVTALTALAAQVSVPLPFTPVPFTLQPMIVLLGGAVLGARLGAASQVLYLSLGILGLPVFAASPLLPQGAARLIGPTAGYLLAYPLAAWLTGRLAERRFDRQYLTSLLAMTAGLAAVFTGGVVWLAIGPTQLGLAAALATGFVPFLPADILKLCVAAAILPGVWKLLTPTS